METLKKQTGSLLCWLSLMLVFASPVQAQFLRCDAYCYISVGDHLSLTLAHDVNTPFAQVRQNPALFEPAPQTHPALGYSQQALWVKMEVNEDTPGKYLVIEKANLNHVTAYQYLPQTGWQALTLGTHHAYHERPIKARALVFPLSEKLSLQTPVYLKIVSDTSLSLPLYLASFDRMQEVFSQHDALAGLFFGILLALAFYHLVIYFVVFDTTYLLFALSAIFYVGFLAAAEGFMQQWLLPDAASGRVTRWLLTCYCFSSFFFYGFLNGIIATRHYQPTLYRVICILQIGFLLMLPAVYTVDYAFMGPFSVFYSALATAVGVLATLKIAWAGYVPARWFVAMWGLFTVASALRMLRLVGFGPALFSGEWALQLASAVGFLCLSLVLAQRIRHMKDAEHKALRHAMQVEQSVNQVLEKKVALRTRELKMEKHYLEYISDARAQFFAHANHEIRTPVTAILQYVSFLQRGVGCRKPEEKELAYLDVVHQHAQRIHALANLWLDQEKLQTLDAQAALTPVDIRGCLAMLFSKLEVLFPSGVALDYDIDRGCEQVRANPEYLECILENLLSNAAKYTAQGSVKVHVERDRGNAATDDVKVWVMDTGIGVAEADRHRIFQPFQQGLAGDAVAGVGLGLSTCKVYVTRMGGEIGVKPLPGGGAAFWFTLRRSE